MGNVQPTRKGIRRAVVAFFAIGKNDDERRHALEDEILVTALQLIVEKGDEKSRKIALAALKTQEAQYPRHCA